MSNKMWDGLIEHAKTCVLSGKLHIYYPDETRTVGVVFNNIYELSGLIASDQYYPADSLSDSQKVCKISSRMSMLNTSDTSSPMLQFMSHKNLLFFGSIFNQLKLRCSLVLLTMTMFTFCPLSS